jgi:hypothetical protein
MYRWRCGELNIHAAFFLTLNSHLHLISHPPFAIHRLQSTVCRYIRVKREKQTFCLLCSAEDTFGTVKEQLAAAMQQHGSENTASNSMRLLLPDATVLDSDKTLSEHDIKSDAVLHLVLAISDSEWEPVDIHSTDLEDA